jgi:hypothetical protein
MNAQNSGNVSIDIVNTLGQRIFTSTEKITTADFRKEIDLSQGLHPENAVARGIYFIEVKTDNGFARKKILIAD